MCSTGVETLAGQPTTGSFSLVVKQPAFAALLMLCLVDHATGFTQHTVWRWNLLPILLSKSMSYKGEEADYAAPHQIDFTYTGKPSCRILKQAVPRRFFMGIR